MIICFVGSYVADCSLDKLLEEKDLIKICEDDVVGMKFLTYEAVEIFYQKYSLYVDFGIRRDDKKKNAKGAVVSRR